VTSYADSRAVLSDPESFTSQYGIFPGSGPHCPDPAAGRTIEVSAGDRHALLRSTLRPFFTQSRQAGLPDACRASLRSSVLPHIGAGTVCDFADAAQRVSWTVFTRLLRVPSADRQMLHEAAHTLLTPQLSTDPDRADPALTRARAQCLEYFLCLIRTRLARPRAVARDVGDALARAVSTGRLTEIDAALNLRAVLTSSNETVRLTLAALPMLFADHPGQLELLRAAPRLIKPATEEVLRWTSPLMYLNRVATRNLELAGAQIAAGESATVALAAANQDPAAFPHPDRFDITRVPNAHLTLGHGPHHCLGATLARIEVSCALEFFAAQVGRVESAGTPRPIASHTFAGWDSAPIVLHPVP
jgi:hydroxylation protein CepL